MLGIYEWSSTIASLTISTNYGLSEEALWIKLLIKFNT